MKPGPRREKRLQALTPEEENIKAEKARLYWEQTIKEINAANKERARVDNILTTLDIPHEPPWSTVSGKVLIDILMDETKVQAILSKIRMKAFW